MSVVLAMVCGVLVAVLFVVVVESNAMTRLIGKYLDWRDRK